jgi:hypothetical protein
MLDALQLVPRDHLSAAVSLIVVYGFGVLVAGAALLALLVRAARLRSRARARFAHASGLTVGPATLRGVVEPAPGGTRGPGVRTAEAWEFDLVLDSGQRVRCESAGHLYRADAMEGDALMATGTAVPEPVALGEYVTVQGVLATRAAPVDAAGGYRDAAARYTLSAPRFGRMMFTAEPLPDRAARDGARRATRWALGLCVALVVVHGGLLGEYHLLTLQGRVVTVEITGSMVRSAVRVAPGTSYGSTFDSRARAAGASETLCMLYGEYAVPGNRLYFVEDEVDCDAFRTYSMAPVPFVVVPDARGLFQLGTRPTISLWKAGLVLLWAISAMIAYRRGARATD